MIEKFTYPFCYTPHPEIVSAAAGLMKKISSSEHLQSLFGEGKMLGVLMVEGPEFLYGFSGTAGGSAIIEGFVPPIFDLTNPTGEYRRREAEISEMGRRIANGEDLREERRKASAELQGWIFRKYVVHNALGEEKSIRDIFAEKGLVPPGGTGDCAAPKLLEYAYRHSLKPIAIGEFWYGKSPVGEIRRQGSFYPSCTGKCGPLLSFMMKGLNVADNPLERQSTSKFDIIFEDEEIIVANKPHGMLSVPGNTGSTSLLDLLRVRCRQRIFSCHRLDMDTSGVMVFAKNAEAQANIQLQFEKRETSKCYLASLTCEGPVFQGPKNGTISLPLILDYYDRPRQMVDFENGKEAVTDYDIIGTDPEGDMIVRFYPRTGRSHQLRVHAAHPLGLGHPIRGDRLYGGGSGDLRLQAVSLSFKHPSTGKDMNFSIAPEETFRIEGSDKKTEKE